MACLGVKLADNGELDEFDEPVLLVGERVGVELGIDSAYRPCTFRCLHPGPPVASGYARMQVAAATETHGFMSLGGYRDHVHCKPPDRDNAIVPRL